MCLHSLPAKAQFVSYCGWTQMIKVCGASPLEELGTLLDRTSQPQQRTHSYQQSTPAGDGGVYNK